ncbi:MAG: 4a-hydroxytetrahydrobiopterin dehydratase [Planctomycetota bacterium]|nr:4a-hydroxytetrahydrobiopterin dehydratase [Planctomycetota bacterium]
MPEKLSEEEIEQRMQDVAEWSVVGDGIQRTYHFRDFVQSIAFVRRVADAAEVAQHHPDILIRYNKVTLSLSTHDAGGITDKDFALARKVDSFAPEASA